MRSWLVLLLLLGSDAFSSGLYDNLTIQLARPLLENEIKPFEITVFPNGKNLPTGQGSVLQGETLYKKQCLMCHGEQGIEGPAARLAGSDGWFSFSDPLRVLRIDKYPVLLISVGGLWPHATSIFDYIRRAMPHYAPKSLSDNDSYALTAYVLYLNEIIGEEVVLDKNTIMQVTMPGLERSVLAWPEDINKEQNEN